METDNQARPYAEYLNVAWHELQSTTVSGILPSTGTIPQSDGGQAKLEQFTDAAERYRTRLIWLAAKIATRREDAEDIVQQALLKAFRKLSDFRGESHIKTWLNAIVQNTAHEYVRNQRRRSFVPLECSPFPDGNGEELDLPDRGMNPEEYFEHWERGKILAAAIGGLGTTNRQVIEMCVVEEIPYVQVATLLNVSLSTIKSRMFRSRRDLRIVIANHTSPSR